jgi:hypothetical protein
VGIEEAPYTVLRKDDTFELRLPCLGRRCGTRARGAHRAIAATRSNCGHGSPNGGFVAVGEPVWARYDAPFVPWFPRWDEILIAVDTVGHAPGG